jgi:hypothetical protein
MGNFLFLTTVDKNLIGRKNNHFQAEFLPLGSKISTSKYLGKEK